MSWILGIFIVAGTAGAVVFFRRRQARKPAANEVPPPSLWNLGLGGIVVVEGVTLDVRRTLDCEEEGVRWRELLVAGEAKEDRFWLSIEDDDGLVIQRSVEIEAPAAIDSGYPKEIQHEQVTYRFEEKGRARVRLRAVDVPDRDGSFAYASWSGPNGGSLTVEVWGGDTDWFLGERLGKGMVDVFGGGDETPPRLM